MTSNVNNTNEIDDIFYGTLMQAIVNNCRVHVALDDIECQVVRYICICKLLL